MICLCVPFLGFIKTALQCVLCYQEEDEQIKGRGHPVHQEAKEYVLHLQKLMCKSKMSLSKLNPYLLM